MNISDEIILKEGQKVFQIEQQAMSHIADSLDENFIAAVRLILRTKGNVIFSGVGKSGHVGRKLAATFASTGTTAYFVHADEAAHGDIGMIRPNDVFIGLSFSGESSELVACIPVIKEMGVKIIAMTGKRNSSLAKISDVVLVTPIEREACPLNLAPTASTTVTMALGDAIAGALIVARGFDKEDFARSHPAGALGRRLLLKVSHVMREGDSVPVVKSDAPALDAISVMAKKHLGCFVVVESGKPIGIFTEGDLARILKEGVDLSKMKAEELMTTTPKTVQMKESAFVAMQIIRNYQINQLIVLDDQENLSGIVHVQDLISAKIA